MTILYIILGIAASILLARIFKSNTIFWICLSVMLLGFSIGSCASTPSVVKKNKCAVYSTSIQTPSCSVAFPVGNEEGVGTFDETKSVSQMYYYQLGTLKNVQLDSPLSSHNRGKPHIWDSS